MSRSDAVKLDLAPQALLYDKRNLDLNPQPASHVLISREARSHPDSSMPVGHDVHGGYTICLHGPNPRSGGTNNAILFVPLGRAAHSPIDIPPPNGELLAPLAGFGVATELQRVVTLYQREGQYTQMTIEYYSEGLTKSALGPKVLRITVTPFINELPEDVMGGSTEDDPAPRSLILRWRGISIETDLPTVKDSDQPRGFIRHRGEFTKTFFAETGAEIGDIVVFERLGSHEFRLHLQKPNGRRIS